MNLVLDEVLSNIIKFSYEPTDNGRIDIELIYYRHRFIATVRDNGKPFDPLQFARSDVSVPPKSRCPGGLGIVFMKRLVDVMTYKRDGAKNELTLVIKVPPRTAHTDEDI
jgi:anti-sigma regulatory factor (Ser/Thr protein kinase)